MAVGCLVGQDVPDGYQQLAGNGNNRLQATEARFQTGELLLTFRLMPWGRCGSSWIDMQSYKPYGEVLESVGEGSSSYGFAAEMADESGLAFLRARYYAPS